MMQSLRYLQRLYSLDTLDTRFTASSRPPTDRTNGSIADDKLPAQQLLGSKDSDDGLQSIPGAQSSKWRTPEFYFYYFIFLTIPPLMFKAVYDVSQPSHPSFSRYEHLLEPGWIPGRKVDNSDAQYAGFRENIPYMGLVLILHPLLRKAYDSLTNPTGSHSTTKQDPNSLSQGLSPTAAADVRLEQRIIFDLAFAFLFLFALHGVSALKIFLILYINFKLTTSLPRSYIPAAAWIFNIGILFANELCHGYKMAYVAAFLLPATTTAADEKTKNWGASVDSYGGLIPRWEILFNFCVLRLISFDFDYYWARDRSAGSTIEVRHDAYVACCASQLLSDAQHVNANARQKKNLDIAALSERDRVATPANVTDYAFAKYLAYVLYSPLYLTGPIVTFNDYISQLRYPLPSITRTRTMLYGIRFLICLLTMELCLHYLYAVAISKSNPDWSIYSPFQLSMLGYFNLHIIWLKLLLPWRFFRLWSLLDGVDPPENMVRCMSDNYSALAFWRGWHRSFNRWITRYIFIPLGGSRVGKVRAIVNFLAVFTFVAIWHDINLRLLTWGWLITLFVLPEVICTLLFPAKKWRDRPSAYRVLCGIGAVGNILMMMAANLVGFAVGLDGLQGLVDGIIGSWGGRVFLLGACGTLFVGVQVMFEVREGEKRKGIKMTC